jgi:hypothetical protein
MSRISLLGEYPTSQVVPDFQLTSEHGLLITREIHRPGIGNFLVQHQSLSTMSPNCSRSGGKRHIGLSSAHLFNETSTPRPKDVGFPRGKTYTHLHSPTLTYTQLHYAYTSGLFVAKPSVILAPTCLNFSTKQLPF